jgi:hypothetical protein
MESSGAAAGVACRPPLRFVHWSEPRAETPETSGAYAGCRRTSRMVADARHATDNGFG